MEDKRITKTKRSLKAAMIEMLSKEDFEHISITELCRKADVSRITFYSHYNDKYALLDDIFEDMLRIGTICCGSGQRTITGDRKKTILPGDWRPGM